MNRAEIFEKLKEIMMIMDPSKSDVLKSADETTGLVDDLGLTSVAILYMVIAIEETFSISFDNLGVDDFKTIGDAVSFIDKKINK